MWKQIKVLPHAAAVVAIFFLTDSCCSEIIGLVFRVCSSVIFATALYVCLDIVSVCAAVFLYARYVLKIPLTELYLGKPFPDLQWCVTAAAIPVVADVIYFVCTKGEFQAHWHTWDEAAGLLFHEICSSGFRVAVTEGILFRGLLSGIVEKGFGTKMGTVVSGFLYAAARFLLSYGIVRNGRNDAGTLLLTALMGLAFTWITSVTGSVWSSVLLQFFYNIVSGNAYILHISNRQDFPALFTYTIQSGSLLFTELHLPDILMFLLLTMTIFVRMKKNKAIGKNKIKNSMDTGTNTDMNRSTNTGMDRSTNTDMNRSTNTGMDRSTNISMTGKMLKDLSIGLVAGAYTGILLYLGGTNMLQQYFSACYTQEAELLEELEEYARRNDVSATDVRKLLLWTEERGIREFKIARKGWLLFDATYPGVILSGKKEQPGSKWRAYYRVTFADGDADVYISTGFDTKYYQILLMVSVTAGFTVCLGIIILGMRENVADIQRLEKEVDAIRRGSLLEPVTLKGTGELGQLAYGLDQMRRQLYEKEKMEKELRAAQEKLVLGMSHDLRTPLTGLMAYMEVLRKQEKEGRPCREYIDKAYDKIMQIKHLSDQMFEYFFIESHQGVELEPLEDISSAFGDYLSELCAMLDCSGFSVDTDTLQWKPAPVRIHADYPGRIINNIFSNLEKYGDRKRQVKIRMIYEPHRVGIGIRNHMAMPDQYVEGTGIGIKNVCFMMEQMGGTAEVSTTEEEYQIILYFPLQEE